MARDFQRSKVYAAERAAFQGGASKVGVPAFFGRHDLSVAEAQAFVDKVIGSAWFARQFAPHGRSPKLRVEAQRGGGARSWFGLYRGVISASGWGRREWVLLHEISHNVTSSNFPGAPWHGWEFCSVYLKLVHHVLGADAGKALKAAFKSGKVKHSKPRPKRQLSPEQAEKARANLAAIRARKAAEKAAAEAAEPLKIEVERKGNFSPQHTVGVRLTVHDRDLGDIYFESDDRCLFTAGAARDLARSKLAEIAPRQAGHVIEARLVGRAKYGLASWHHDKSEVIVARFDPELAAA